ncbi:MAG: SH3 domain-containing protein [Chloroflexi bacterium]|nr:SH3 domain-containing protein [Chloroflexota bacterium]
MKSRFIGLVALLLVGLLLPAVISAQTGTPTPRATLTARATVTATPRATVSATVSATPTATPTGTLPTSTPVFDCPAIVENALSVVREECQDLAIDEICYGYLVLDASPRAGVQQFRFVRPGDIADVVDIESLRLNAMDIARGFWGVVLMQIQTSPNSEPTTILLFGNVSLDTTSQFVPVTADEDVRLRAEPTTSGEILGVLAQGESITANGRLEDGSWLRVRVPTSDNTFRLGWLAAEFVTPSGDLSALPIVSPDDEVGLDDVSFGPMQAFTLQTGSDDAPCSEAPNSGILVQSPEGAAAISISIDEVVIELNGTAFVQTNADGQLQVNQLDGASQVTANGETSTAVAGTSVSVQLGDDLTPVSGPSAPQPIDSNDVQALPTELLPDQVTVPTPLPVTAGQPIAGNWRFTWGVASATCPDGTVVPFESAGELNDIRMNGAALLRGGISYTFDGTNYIATYTDGLGNIHSVALNVAAPDRINGSDTIEFAGFNCQLTVPFTLTLVSSGG